MENILGKRKMNSIMSHETGILYRDAVAYGRYEFSGTTEKLVVGAYGLVHETASGKTKLYEPDFSGDEPKYVARDIKVKGEADSVH